MPGQEHQVEAPAAAKPEPGASKFRVTCPNHGVLGVANSAEDAHKIAADHFHLGHAALVRDNLDNLQVEVAEFKTFGVAEAAKFEKPPEPDIVPGKLVTKTNV